MWSVPRTWVTGEIVTSSMMNLHVRDNFNSVLPTGAYIYRAGSPTAVETTLEDRWLECNGVAVSRSTYATLFGVISTTFGIGDNSTTFNLPDFRGRSPYGAGSEIAYGTSDGQAAGSRGPNHTHSIPTQNIESPNFNPAQHTTDITTTGGLSDPPGYIAGGVFWIKYI